MSSDGYTDAERIELFLERVEKLRNNSLNKTGKLKRVTAWSRFDDVNGHRHEILGADNEPIDMEKFDALVAAFRLVYMEKEPAFIEHVFDVVVASLEPSRQQQDHHFKINWRRALEEDTHLLDDQNQFLKIDFVLKNWLYGETFHSDRVKREFVKRLGGYLPGEIVMIVNFLSHYVFWLADFVSQGLDEKWLLPSVTNSTPKAP